MHHDIQNFSQLTAIDGQGLLKVRVAMKAHGNVKFTVQVNDHTTTSIVDSDATHYFDLLESVTVKIRLETFEEGTSGAEITNLSINGLEVIPRYRHLANKPTTYLDFYDEWVLEIPAPFYVWYHEISGQGWIA